MNEIWKSVKDFPDYQISNYGRIKSFKRKKEKILKPGKDKDGYIKYSLYCNNIKLRISAHRLVLETFNPIENMNNLEVNHKDGNKENNYTENLEWCTKSENEKHAYKLGLKIQKNESKNIGENNSQSKLTEKMLLRY